MPRTLYLDTTLWNRLFEKAVDPVSLTASLKQRGWELALSTHVIYELAKSFRAKREQSVRKAVPLFSYLEKFLAFPISYVKQVPDLLRDEVQVAGGSLRRIEPFYRDEHRDRVTEEVGRLAAGYVDPRFDSLLASRTTQVSDFRAQVRLTAAAGSLDLPLDDFMRISLRQFGTGALEQHISHVIPDLAPKAAKRLARKILSSRKFRFCHALVRADAFLTWLWFQDRTIRRDTLDDCYHVENAAHCDAYVTDDSGQREYADAVLTVTTVRVHDKRAPLLEWLTTTAIQ